MTATRQEHQIVSPTQWLEARKALLAAEKELTRQRDEISRQRRALPWVRVEKDYAFDGVNGAVTLRQLFAGRSQVIVYHFMFGPEWKEGCRAAPFCPTTSTAASLTLPTATSRCVVVSRAPLDHIQAFQKRMGWRFPWVSSHRNEFNRDYHVPFSPEEMAAGKVYYNYQPTKFPSEEAPGASVFYQKPSGDVFHTYSTYGRGLDLWSAPTAISTWCPRVGMKTGWSSPCPGSGTTTSTATITCSTPLRLMRSRAKWAVLQHEESA